MAREFNKFTAEQIQILRENLWVKKVTAKMLVFTDEFKEEFHRQHQEGKSSRQIIEALGLDAEMLGRTRIEGIQLVVKDYIAKKAVVANSEYTALEISGNSTTAQLKKMAHRLEYAEQQIEFIKKTILLDREAGRNK